MSIALESDIGAVRAIFRHIWGAGQDGQDPASRRPLARSLGVDDFEARIGDPAMKDQLRRNTDAAIERGVFGIPTFVIDKELFWGDDVTGMMLDYLENPDLFKQGGLERLADQPIAAQRKQSRL